MDRPSPAGHPPPAPASGETGTGPAPGSITSDIPARLDRLPWSGWHWRVTIALGVAWVLDGLEVTLVGSIGGVLERADTLALSATQVGWAGSLYIAGAVVGALGFGRLADRLGRKTLFMMTLAIYMAATLATAFSPDFLFFAVCRFATGLGIGGEYAAINSAIDELIPARVRGRVNLAINGSFWLGAALGAGLSLLLLDPRVLGPELGWRAGFGLGAVLALAILLVRRDVPESPRWLLSHGRGEEAHRIIDAIEARVRAQHGELPPAQGSITFRRRAGGGLREVARVLLQRYRRRSAVALALMVSQAFFYNAIFFTYALALTRYMGVSEERVALYVFPFALGNVLGPLVLGPLFDRVGRRRMIAATYACSGVALAITAWVFVRGWLGADGLALCWSAVFFLASAAASSAYLTVSEVFPLETRALAISIFYAVGTGVGGVIGPALFGHLIESGSRADLAAGYLAAAVLVIGAGLLALRHGVDAERKPLEEIATPLGAE
ncbi:MFS transporter [Bordetella genomosp. 10]|uniref:MFS transporter n=2 Tax=Bordetella genomosp. 10 TaxID=1416804 RepID=A0A261S021_9BORD|nr:MFS transporter [Bordetella genomosp. 10]